jgi:hypothetical protein
MGDAVDYAVGGKARVKPNGNVTLELSVRGAAAAQDEAQVQEVQLQAIVPKESVPTAANIRERMKAGTLQAHSSRHDDTDKSLENARNNAQRKLGLKVGLKGQWSPEAWVSLQRALAKPKQTRGGAPLLAIADQAGNDSEEAEDAKEAEAAEEAKESDSGEEGTDDSSSDDSDDSSDQAEKKEEEEEEESHDKKSPELTADAVERHPVFEELSQHCDDLLAQMNDLEEKNAELKAENQSLRSELQELKRQRVA